MIRKADGVEEEGNRAKRSRGPIGMSMEAPHPLDASIGEGTRNMVGTEGETDDPLDTGQVEVLVDACMDQGFKGGRA